MVVCVGRMGGEGVAHRGSKKYIHNTNKQEKKEECSELYNKNYTLQFPFLLLPPPSVKVVMVLVEPTPVPH